MKQEKVTKDTLKKKGKMIKKCFFFLLFYFVYKIMDNLDEATRLVTEGKTKVNKLHTCLIYD